MAGQQAAAVRKGGDSADRLVEAVLSAWEQGGHAAVSARGLARATGLPVSSIYHHFGDLEQLYATAHERARTRAERWCAQRLDELADSANGLASLAGLLAATIDDWCEGERVLAFAWRECQLLAARDSRHAAPAARWRSLWSEFWQAVCDRLAIGPAAELTARLFDGESFLHMLRWRRSVDRAGLEELCRGWAAWMDGTLAPPAPWRQIARDYAQRSGFRRELREETADRITAAAAMMLERGGVAGVTHRAVAGEAGLTLGVVSHKFRTSADLLSAAFEETYCRAVPTADMDPEHLRDLDHTNLLERIGKQAGTERFRLAIVELMMAAMRDPALAPFAAQLRYLRGRTSGLFLQSMLGRDRSVSALDAAIFSSFTIGQGNGLAGLPDAERDRIASAEIDALFARLQAR